MNNEPDKFEDVDGIFGISETSSEKSNRRIAVRYIRNDLNATLFVKRFFSTKKFSAQVYDISSKGINLATSAKLSKEKKIQVLIVFPDDKSFNLDAIIVHRSKKKSIYNYGIKFQSLSNELGEHLLNTQTDLTFKL